MAHNNSNRSNRTQHNISTMSFMSSIISPSLGSVSTISENGSSSDPTVVEIDKLLSHLKYKQALQDDDNSDSKVIKVLSSPAVSHVIACLAGEGKCELKSDVREIFKNLEKFVKDYVKETKVSSGSKGLELLQKLLFGEPEKVVLQQCLGNEPKDWVGWGLNVVQDNLRKEVEAERIEEDTQDVHQSRLELARDIGLEKKRRQKLKLESEKMTKRMSADNIRRLEIALESYKNEADKMKESLDKRGSSVSYEEMADLAARLEEMKTRHKAAKEELSKLSANNSLPPNLPKAREIAAGRVAYLDDLKHQINNPAELSLNLNTSVF